MDPADLELPEPLEPSTELAAISNDEFLSQVASQEIERLLAEVDDQIDAALAAEQAKGHEPQAALAFRKYPQATSQPALPEVVEGEQASPAEAPKPNSIIWDDPHEPPIAARADMFGAALTADASVPAYCKPLEWLNAPFEGISAAALSVIGKLAIFFFIAALGAVVYVVMLR